jgi:hypothetical protein
VHAAAYFDDAHHPLGAASLRRAAEPGVGRSRAESLAVGALHAAYLSYYFIIFVPPLRAVPARPHAMRLPARRSFAVMLSFFAHYLFFIFFPVQGPRYLFPRRAASSPPARSTSSRTACSKPGPARARRSRRRTWACP